MTWILTCNIGEQETQIHNRTIITKEQNVGRQTIKRQRDFMKMIAESSGNSLVFSIGINVAKHKFSLHFGPSGRQKLHSKSKF